MADIIEPKTTDEGEEITHGNPPSVDIGDSPNYQSLKGYFGITDPSQAEEDALNWLATHYEVDKVDNMADILWELKSLDMKLGAPQVGMSRLIAMRNYIKLNSHIFRLEKERELMER